MSLTGYFEHFCCNFADWCFTVTRPDLLTTKARLKEGILWQRYKVPFWWCVYPVGDIVRPDLFWKADHLASKKLAFNVTPCKCCLDSLLRTMISFQLFEQSCSLDLPQMVINIFCDIALLLAVWIIFVIVKTSLSTLFFSTICDKAGIERAQVSETMTNVTNSSIRVNPFTTVIPSLTM